MKVELLRCTPDAVELIVYCCRVSGMEEIDNEEILRTIIDCDYSSVLEHIVFTFDIRDISIALSRELLEHRMASHTAKSTRYVDMNVTDHISIDDMVDNSMMIDIAKYQNMKKYIGKEKARYVLPLGTTTHYILTMNARSLINFFGLRLCHRSAPEMQELARRMRQECMKVYPEIFGKIGCRGYNNGICKEKDRSNCKLINIIPSFERPEV